MKNPARDMERMIRMAEPRNPTLVEKTSEKITEFIITNRMTPGMRLPTETEFLAQLGVSRGTLREAFKLLAARNILEIRQGSGTFLAEDTGIPEDPLGLKFIYDDHRLALDMLDVRLLLEPHTAMLAAANATRHQKEAIQQQTLAMEALIEHGESYAAADAHFHQLIAQASGNQVIAHLYCILNSSVSRNIAITLDLQRENNTIFYHRRIARAILEGNVNNASYEMHMHLNLLREFVLQRIEEHRQLVASS